MKQVRISPYVGQKYQEGWNGKKILILGESHYNPNKHEELNKNEGDCTRDRQQATNEVIYDFVYNHNGFEGWKNTYTCFERLLTNKALSQEERVDLWSRVVFYQFVQYFQKDPRKAPENSQFELSKEPFIEVVKTYMPDYIIVWGKRLFGHLPALGGEEELITIKGDSLPVRKYTIEGKIIPALAIYHPSIHIGKSWKRWHPFIDVFLNKKFEMDK